MKGKKASKKSTPSDKSSYAGTKTKTTKHDEADSRSNVFKETQIKPQLHKAYSGDDADILEGDDEDDDMIPISRGKYVLQKISTPCAQSH